MIWLTNCWIGVKQQSLNHFFLFCVFIIYCVCIEISLNLSIFFYFSIIKINNNKQLNPWHKMEIVDIQTLTGSKYDGWLWFDFWCFNATFSTISVISWRPVLVVEEAEYQDIITDHEQATGILYHLRRRVESTLFVIHKAGREHTPYWW